MAVYSASRISLFEQCPRRYFFVHIARVPGEPGVQHPATFLGSRVHEALEHLYAEVQAGRTITVDELAAWFRSRWMERWGAEPAALPPDDSVERWITLGVDCLIRYYARHHPFDEDETLGLERFVEFPLDTEGAIRIRGFIDRLARTRDGTIRVHDYKTQESVPDQAAVDSDRQLSFYEMAVRHQLGHTGPVELVWHFVRSDVTRTSSRTPAQIDRVRQEAISRIRDIESRGGEAAAFEPNPSLLCRWCEHSGGCPEGRTRRAER